MDTKVYQDPTLFWSEVSPSLLKEEAKNSLILGLSKLFTSNPASYVFQAALFDGAELRGAVVVCRHNLNQNLLPSPTPSIEYAGKLFAILPSRVTGIVGETSTVGVYSTLFEKQGHRTKPLMTQGIYRCREVIWPKRTEAFQFRRAEESDLDLITQWVEEFQREAIPHETPINVRTVALDKIRHGMIFMLLKSYKPLAMAAWSRDLGTSCTVNLVYTPKPERKNGYGSMVTAYLTQHLLTSGKRETNLYTDMSNPTSNKIYQSIGYKFVSDSIHLEIVGRDLKTAP